MKTAIDRLKLGEEKEINIKDFDGYNGYNRFVCPECCEYVFPCLGKGAHFSHFKKRDVDCSRRVDGQVSCTFYERVGLPIYLREENNNFTLYIGFYALGKGLLDLALSQTLSVDIEPDYPYSKTKQRYLVDFTFYEDQITLKPLSFIPTNGKDYKISLPNTDLSKRIFKKWSDYADGFTSYGAIFTYSESGGKKIRRNDTITTDIDYYMMISEGRFIARDGMLSEICSNLNVNGRKFEIRKIKLEPKDRTNFKNLEDFVWENFSLRLLYNKPEIIPIWPPSVQSNGVNHILHLSSTKNSVFCKVTSNSDTPSIYKYTGDSYTEIKTTKSNNDTHFVNLTISGLLQPFTVDRKYLANAVMFSQKKPTPYLTNYCIDVKCSDFMIALDNQNIHCIDAHQTLKVKSNTKLTVIKVNKGGELVKDCINDSDQKDIEISNDCLDVWLYSETKKQIIGRFFQSSSDNKFISKTMPDVILSEQIKQRLKQQTIILPRRYASVMFKLKDYPLTYQILKSFISSGRIQSSVIKILQNGGFFDER